MNKLLIVCGPTATGKTSLGILLANRFDGEIISADSRQVYKDMDIGTGKQRSDRVIIHGYDIVDPEDDYSVSSFVAYARNKIKKIMKRGKLPILVGGTGFYIKGVVDGIDTISIPRNDRLRKNLERMGPDELYDKLGVLDSSKAASLNLSDKKNPRRLIRAIEVAQWNVIHGVNKGSLNTKNKKDLYDTFFVGLSLQKDSLLKKIEKRVEERMNNGFIYEIESLLKSGVSWKDQSMKSLGYREVEDFLKKGLSYEEFIDKWITNEFKYAKRQIVWFKKDKRINWFDVDKPDYPRNVEKLVEKWYPSAKGHAKKS